MGPVEEWGRILRRDLGPLERWRERLLGVAQEAGREAEKLNPARAAEAGLFEAVRVTAAALAIVHLLAERFGEAKRPVP